MSNPDSFIDEVTEEVRRDRLFKLMRKYGWIAVLLVVVLVGGAAFNEWRKASARATAEALGDAVLAAMSTEDVAARKAALLAIETDDAGAALLDLLAAGAGEGGDPAGDVAALTNVSDNPDLPQIYRDLARLKLVTLPQNNLSASERMSLLEPLAAAGAPYRVLAEEQMALVQIELGDTQAAMSRLRQLLVDEEASQALRRRASQLIVSLGGTPDAS